MLQLSAAELKDLSNVQLDALADFILTFSKDDPIFPAPIVESEDEDVSDEQLAEVAFSPAQVTGTNDRLDIHGLPWDERIHASSHAKTADGSWRAKRNVEPALVATVESELKALMAIPAVAPFDPTQAFIDKALREIPATVSAPPPPPVAAAPPAPVAAPPPPPPAPTPIVVPPAGDPKLAFVDLITWASKAIGENKFTKEELASIVVSHGVAKLPLLAERLDLIPQVRASLEALIATR